MNNSHSIAVIYIARKTNAGLISLMRFLESTAQNSSGMDYDLVIIAKGWEDGSIEFQRVQVLGEKYNAKIVVLPDQGYDWGAYFRIAKIVEHQRLCFFNSHSTINGKNWLSYLVAGLALPGVGAAGATGSYGSWSFSLPYLNRDLKSFALYLFRVVKAVLTSLQHYSDSSPFPCLHLRSNAFIITREHFLEFAKSCKIPSSKKEAHTLESGLYSLTSFFQKKGLQVVVVGKDGKAYLPENWMSSQTFRVPEQNNLLISDNQTNNYQVAELPLKRRLEWAAWGRLFS